MIRVDTAAYTRTHGHTPWHTQGQGKSMWAFTIDGAEEVRVKYGRYTEALLWAKSQARECVKVLP